jgi:hypothetical protein
MKKLSIMLSLTSFLVVVGCANMGVNQQDATPKAMETVKKMPVRHSYKGEVGNTK